MNSGIGLYEDGKKYRHAEGDLFYIVYLDIPYKIVRVLILAIDTGKTKCIIVESFPR